MTNPSSDEHTTYCLFCIWDRYFVDTGVAISVIPHITNPSGKPTSLKLQAANGSTIDTYGGKTLTLNIGMRRDYFHAGQSKNTDPWGRFPGTLRTVGSHEPKNLV